MSRLGSKGFAKPLTVGGPREIYVLMWLDPCRILTRQVSGVFLTDTCDQAMPESRVLGEGDNARIYNPARFASHESAFVFALVPAGQRGPETLYVVDVRSPARKGEP